MPTQQLQLSTGIAITPSDTFVYPRGVLIYVGVGGDVTITTLDDNVVTLGGVSSGTFLPVHAKKLMATGTTADRFVGNLLSSPVSDYFEGMPSFVTAKYSLAFDAAKADELNDYDVNTLYFRDKSFARVPATFSRTSAATRVNRHGLIETVASGVPRIDYSDGSAKLLLEPSRTNTMDYSENLGVYVVSPPVSRIVAGTFLNGNNAWAFSGLRLRRNYFFTAGVTYTASFYGKTLDSNTFNVRLQGIASDVTVSVNTDTGAIAQIGGFAADNLGSYYVADGWFRFYVTVTAIINNSPGNYIGLESAPDFVLVSGVQFEAGSYPTSYIPTAGSAVTRSADSATVSNLVSGGYLAANQGTILEWIDGTKTARQYTTDGNVETFVSGSSTGTAAGTPPTSLSYPIANIDLIEKVILFPTALTDAECIALTS